MMGLAVNLPFMTGLALLIRMFILEFGFKFVEGRSEMNLLFNLN